MKLSKKDKGETGDQADVHHHFPWDAALAGLNSGAYDTAGYPVGERADVDMPLAQSPAPGVNPLGSTESAAPGDVLTNVAPSAGAVLAPGIPTSPAPETPDAPRKGDKADKAK